MRQQRKQNYHVFMKTWFWGRNGRQNRNFSVLWWFLPTVVRAITRFEKNDNFDFSVLWTTKKWKNTNKSQKNFEKVNTKCDFRQFRLDSKSYNLIFYVFFVFLADRKCQPLSSFWKSDGFRWSRNVHMKGKTSQKWSASDFNFGHNQVRDSARELGGSLSFCQIMTLLSEQTL